MAGRGMSRQTASALALSAARRAAALASDTDVRAAAFLLQGQINAISHGMPPKDAEPAYRALCAVPGHPVARAAREARWFPWSAAAGFLEPLNRVRRNSSLPFAALSDALEKIGCRTLRPKIALKSDESADLAGAASWRSS